MHRRTVALIGAGAMGSNHARVLGESDRARLDLIIDTCPDRAAALAEKAGCRWATELEPALACDVAIVAPPPEWHADAALTLLSEGIPTLVEKPLSTTLDEARAIVDASERADVPVTCGFVERFNPVVRTALSMMDQDPVHVLAVRHSPPNDRATASVV